ncbi:hypothetical protein MASR2M78_35600 [Treponema sp.]
MKRIFGAALISLSLCINLYAENFRTIIAGRTDVSAETQEGTPFSLSYVDSILIGLPNNGRFLRGIELELRVPATFLKYKGSLAIAFYNSLEKVPNIGVSDLSARRIGFELFPNKLQTVYQIPLRSGLKASPYVSIPSGIQNPSQFPLLIRLMPVIKGLSEDIENMRFQLTVKPVLSDEGALKLVLRYPESLKDRPLTVRVDDEVIEYPLRELVLKEGEHHLAIVSDAYRNESRRILIERGKVLELNVELQDPTPVINFEAPENTTIIFDGIEILDKRSSLSAEPGEHELRFNVGDYSVTKNITLIRGRTYKVALSIDVSISESE